MGRIAVALSVVALTFGCASAGLIRVPDDFSSIGAAVWAAGDGDTVLVRAGIYRGPENRRINFRGADIVLLAEDGPGATVIDCQWEERAFELKNGESPAAVVDGFTIFAGTGTWDLGYEAGGAYVSNSSPTIRNCVFCSCHAPEGSAGHSSWSSGGGIVLGNSASTVSNCTFLLCTVVEESLNPSGSAIVATGSVQIRNCVVDQCTAAGGAIRVQPGCVVHHCVADSSVSTTTGAPSPEDNLWSVDPLVCDWPLSEWGHPCSNSPVLPENNAWGELVGVSSIVCSQCDSPVEAKSWGAIKALYR